MNILRGIRIAVVPALVMLSAACEEDDRDGIIAPDTVTVTKTDTLRIVRTDTVRIGSNLVLAQVERLGNPLAMEVFVEKRFHAQHDVFPPTRDPATFTDDYVAFITTVAGRDEAYARVIAGALLGTAANPGDKIQVFTNRAAGVTAATANDPNNMNVGWLTYVLDPVNGYGGRKLRGDDVVDKGAGAVFGNLLGNNNNVSPGLVTDNVGNTNPAPLTTFPYFPANQ